MSSPVCGRGGGGWNQLRSEQGGRAQAEPGRASSCHTLHIPAYKSCLCLSRGLLAQSDRPRGTWEESGHQRLFEPWCLRAGLQRGLDQVSSGRRVLLHKPSGFLMGRKHLGKAVREGQHLGKGS